MNSIQERISAVLDAIEVVKSHCMCASFEDIGGAFRVIYPYGMFPHGAQANYSGPGKLVALNRLLDVMERHWKENGIY